MGDSLIKDDVLGICVINAISNVPGLIDRVMATEGFDAKNVDIKFIVNGIEVNAKETLERMWQIREEHVTRHAKKLIDNAIGEVTNEAYLLAERMKSMLPWSE
jgi:hypothetical protein